jgi:nucleoside-diphosphate-sugar epimerase
MTTVDPAMTLKFDPSKPSGVKRRVMSTSRAESRLGFKPEVSLSAGLKETVSWVYQSGIYKDWV